MPTYHNQMPLIVKQHLANIFSQTFILFVFYLFNLVADFKINLPTTPSCHLNLLPIYPLIYISKKTKTEIEGIGLYRLKETVNKRFRRRASADGLNEEGLPFPFSSPKSLPSALTRPPSLSLRSSIAEIKVSEQQKRQDKLFFN
uniref:Uncharacterized protein n=1 Tax=Rhizophora mucronata TaxID=61149 RepID=A0A2P2NG91_RHIMU